MLLEKSEKKLKKWMIFFPGAEEKAVFSNRLSRIGRVGGKRKCKRSRPKAGIFLNLFSVSKSHDFLTSLFQSFFLCRRLKRLFWLLIREE